MSKRIAPFGYVDYEDIEGVFTCQRLINGLQLLDKTL